MSNEPQIATFRCDVCGRIEGFKVTTLGGTPLGPMPRDCSKCEKVTHWRPEKEEES